MCSQIYFTFICTLLFMADTHSIKILLTYVQKKKTTGICQKKHGIGWNASFSKRKGDVAKSIKSILDTFSSSSCVYFRISLIFIFALRQTSKRYVNPTWMAQCKKTSGKYCHYC